MAAEHDAFHPVDTLANTASTILQTTACGAIVAGVQNTLRKQNVGAMGIITRSGHIIATFAGVGAFYQFSRDSAANLRSKEDAYNEAIGGFMGGAVVGLARRRIPVMLGSGAALAVVMSAFYYTKGFRGYRYGQDLEEDEVERKERMKKLRRRPIQETIDQLGEGRGIYAPGWEERRRERLMKKYGVDVGPYQ
ncbi:uncharacterized protein BDR25DRAFT_305958 [Lindgomyces ingoldianus]|uniref:Uncharacterized protein n=1 Tax=Lindgomyces ingoldianus TaxID=673940 RepID=A0ACB6QII0_9PLEO|nr:uncharacterized protein BDR25DRAFT_305958 [Lindgomyces ingoldianus]KAF2466741.1 hypothetical protein BDR25DRAFT_305958 [Lindgomyces ingoldianus]